MSSDANDFLMGGGGAKSARFQGRNNPVRLAITQAPEVRQRTDFNTKEPKFFKNGDPMNQLVVTGKTDQIDENDSDDTGIRALYIKGKEMTDVVRNAVRASGAKGLEVGGVLTMTWVSGGPRYEGDSTWAKECPKVYTASYEKAAAAAANAYLNAEPAQQAQPAAQPAAGGAPAGVDPAIWAQMGTDQRASVLAALGQTR